MTVIGIHTPKPDIIKANFPGLLMQCKAYRPCFADVRVACASTLPMDPLNVGVNADDVAPEDLFNPILYKACSNFGMSQIEARIAHNSYNGSGTVDVAGNTADIDVDTLTSGVDEFPIYYGFLSNTHEWKHANPQSGLSMSKLRPLVYEMLWNVGDQNSAVTDSNMYDHRAGCPNADGSKGTVISTGIKGNSKPIPWINCTSYTGASPTPQTPGFVVGGESASAQVRSAEQDVPWINCVVGAIIIPPSRLHQLFYRMVVEWTIEFSQIRPLSEITNWAGLSVMAGITHYQNYDYNSTKQALGVEGELMDHDQTMVSSNVDINKVM